MNSVQKQQALALSFSATPSRLLIKAAGSESSSSSTNEGGAKAGKDGKSSQAEATVEIERHRTREHKSGKNGK